MKILYFGTVCNIEEYEKMLSGCKSRPSVASAVYETSLLSGMKSNCADIEIHSFPMIPIFPKSRWIYWGEKKEKLDCGYECTWLKTLNLPFLKQFFRKRSARKAIKKFIKENRENGVILTYSIPPFLAGDVIKYGKKYSVKTVAIVPDLPENMYINHKSGFLKKMYLGRALKYQKEYDGYVYLTEAMSEKIAPEKQYIVVEGLLSEDMGNSAEVEKSSPRAVMYAGRLHRKYGVMNLVDAFDSLSETDAELWLFGDGTAVSEIEERAKKNPKIKYFGRVSRNEILEYEKKATLLVNPRSVDEEFTKYSFPSKNIEYMYSGTPFLTTALEGIPKEYNDYLFIAENNNPETLAEEMKKILSMSDVALSEKGKKAQLFIANNKNSVVQSKRIIDFLDNQANN